MNGFIFHWLPTDRSSTEDERCYLVLANSFEEALENVRAFALRENDFALYDQGDEVRHLALALGLQPGEVREFRSDGSALDCGAAIMQAIANRSGASLH